MWKNNIPVIPFGPKKIPLSCIGIGGWLGLLDNPQATQAEKETAAINAVRRALELGVNYFDTSPAYGGGEAEYHLGLGLQALSTTERANIYLSTKVGTHPQRAQQYHTDAVHWSLDKSMALFASDYIDIVYIHDPSTDAHMDKIMAPDGALFALEKIKGEGRIGAIGLGVRNHRYLQRAIDSKRFDAILPSYDFHLLRTSAQTLMQHAYKQGMGVVNGSPYNAGVLAGLHPEASAKRRGIQALDLQRAKHLWQWCEARQLDIGVLAVQFSLRQDFIHTTLVGPRTVSEVEQNVRHATTTIATDIWSELETFLSTLGSPGPGGETH